MKNNNNNYNDDDFQTILFKTSVGLRNFKRKYYSRRKKKKRNK